MSHIPTPENFVERRAHDRFRLLFEHSSDAHFIMIGGRVTDCNDAAVKLLKYSSRNEVLAVTHIAELSPEYQPDGMLSEDKFKMMDALARQNGHHRFEWIHRKKDGELFPVEVSANTFDFNGQPALIAVWHDLTERKKNEEAIRQANEKLKQDLKAAAEIQKSLLPVKSPLVKGLRTAWNFRPSEELAGDILNVFALDEKNVGFYVLDAAGHGVGASLLSVTVAHFLSPFSESSLLKAGDAVQLPHVVARQLNQHFSSNPEASHFFTLLYGILNLKTYEFNYCCAGHLAPLRSARDCAEYLPGASGPPIGVIAEAEYKNTNVKLKQGDRLFIYSDGLIEAENVSGEQHGAARFSELIAAQHQTALSDSVASIVKRIENWCAPTEPTDDISLLAFELVSYQDPE